MDHESQTVCVQCQEPMISEAISCHACGALDPARTRVCPTCEQPFPAGFAFCPSDGARLASPAATGRGAELSQSALEDIAPPSLESDGSFDAYMAAARAFWQRHMILNGLTLAAIISWIGYYGSFGEGFALLGLATTLPLAFSWPIALASSSRALGFVGWIDKWYFRLVDFFSRWDGKVGRWLMYPVVWAGGRWAMFASRRGDRFVAASLRMFGYSVALMIVAILAIVAVYIIIGLVLLAVGLWLVGVMLGEDGGGRGGFERVPMVGRRGHKLYEGDGGWLSTDRQVGRVDQDGDIYEDDGGFFSVPKRVGKVDRDGRIYEGEGGWFDVDRQVGRIAKDGQIYEDDGGLFSSSKRVGKIDSDGEIYEGDGGWLSPESRIGKSKRDN